MSNKRRFVTALPEPERVLPEIIARCRLDIETPLKRMIRALIVPLVQRYFRLGELGEGFHWPLRLQMKIAPGSRIGRFAYLGPGFQAFGPVVVGDLCMVAAGCKIVGADHVYNRHGVPTRLAFPTEPRPITCLGADVWLGQRVTIVEGVTIGRGAVVGSASVVTKDVPAYAVVVGVPARFVKWRFNEEEIRTHDAMIVG